MPDSPARPVALALTRAYRDHVAGKLVSTAELARALHVAPRTIVHWKNEKGLEPDAVTLGGHARWDVERVKSWVRNRLASGEDSIGPTGRRPDHDSTAQVDSQPDPGVGNRKQNDQVQEHRPPEHER